MSDDQKKPRTRVYLVGSGEYIAERRLTMTCSLCLDTTSALQTIGADGRCPRCGADYSSFVHTSSAPALETRIRCATCQTEVNPHTGRCPWYCGDGQAHVIAPAVREYNIRTRKLMVRGDAYRDRLVAARLSLRSNL